MIRSTLDTSALSTEFQSAQPFSHVVMDDFLENQIHPLVGEIDELCDPQGSFSPFNWKSEIHDHSNKFYLSDLSMMPYWAHKILTYLNSQSTLDWLSELTGIPNLIADPSLKGGGIHRIKTGGFLGIHEDFNQQSETGLYRRLNLLLYISPEWKPEWGGELELWSVDDKGEPKECARKIAPIFNRCVIFKTTGHAPHGHPNPYLGPERLSLALYYYTKEKPEEHEVTTHGAVWKMDKHPLGPITKLNNGRVTIFTPTHRPDWIFDLYSSIRSQEEDVQWIIVPNAGAVIPDVIAKEPWVKVVPCRFPTPSVGALKGFAIQHADGDTFLEVDHDDVLLPGALKWVKENLTSGKVFGFSPTIETKPDANGNIIDAIYDSSFGWEHGEWTDDKGKLHRYNKPFDATARSICEVFFAPNHLRAWTREAYEAAGGYDPTYTICDDQDLMIRTYLAGAEFKCSPEPLYWQRLRPNSRQFEVNASIQETQARVRDKYIYLLIDEWCRRESLLKVDLGGALSRINGYICVDKREPADIKCNIGTDPLPFPDNSVGIVRTHDFMEHLAPDKIYGVVNEIWRVLAPGAWWDSATPSIDGPDGIPGRGAWQDFDHKSQWSTNSFWYFTRKEQAQFAPECHARFQTVQMLNHYPSQWHQNHRIPYVTALLSALKGQRQPGAIGFPR